MVKYCYNSLYYPPFPPHLGEIGSTSRVPIGYSGEHGFVVYILFLKIYLHIVGVACVVPGIGGNLYLFYWAFISSIRRL
jgi:hypothetical protein